jgi:hypothetical protein
MLFEEEEDLRTFTMGKQTVAFSGRAGSKI